MSELTIQEMRTYCEAVIHAARTGQVKFKLTIEEPSETDIQADILQALGRQDRVLVERNGRTVAVLDGLHKRPGGVFWRANCGGGMANGRVIRGNPNGTADILGVIHGRPVAIEVKTRTGKQRASQAHWQAAWEAAGGLYVVVRSVQEAIDWVGRGLMRVAREGCEANGSWSEDSKGCSRTIKRALKDGQRKPRYARARLTFDVESIRKQALDRAVSRGLKPRELAVVAEIVKVLDVVAGYAIITRETLAERTGLDVRSISRMVARLEARGVLAVERRRIPNPDRLGSTKNAPNQYRIV